MYTLCYDVIKYIVVNIVCCAWLFVKKNIYARVYVLITAVLKRLQFHYNFYLVTTYALFLTFIFTYCVDIRLLLLPLKLKFIN